MHKGKGLPRTGHEGPEGGYRYSSTLSLASALDGVGGQRHALAALDPGKRRGTHCIAGWVGSRAGLDGCGKYRPYGDSIPGPKIFTKVKTTFCYSKKRNVISLFLFYLLFRTQMECNRSGAVSVVAVTLLLLNTAI